VLSLAAAAQAWAQYPGKAIRLIVRRRRRRHRHHRAQLRAGAGRQPRPAGGDRETAAAPAGLVGSDIVAKAAPDGYTLLMVYISHANQPDAGQ